MENKFGCRGFGKKVFLIELKDVLATARKK